MGGGGGRGITMRLGHGLDTSLSALEREGVLYQLAILIVFIVNFDVH